MGVSLVWPWPSLSTLVLAAVIAGATGDCPAGSFGKQVEHLKYCIECPKGKFQIMKGAIFCSTCPTDMFSSKVGSTMCTDCPSGRSQPQPGSADCVSTNPGAPTLAPTPWNMCPAGKHMNIFNCRNCTAGRFQPRSGRLNCNHCPVGKYTRLTGRQQCSTCPVGRVSSVSKMFCILHACPAGKHLTTGFGGSADKLVCTFCYYGEYGKMNATTRTGDCLNCPGGKYVNEYGQSRCHACPATKFSRPREQHCTKCPQGKFQHIAEMGYCNAATLAICGAGRYSRYERGNERCYKCPVGTYQREKGASSCIRCALGMAAPQRESTRCAMCPKGKSSSGSGATCDQCMEGRYAGLMLGHPFCFNCPAGKFSSRVNGEIRGFSNCTGCAAGRAQPKSGQTACQTCPPGLFQPETGWNVCKKPRVIKPLLCPKGKFQGSKDKKTVHCLECPVGKFSVARDNFLCSKCPKGKHQSQTSYSYCLGCNAGRFVMTPGSSHCVSCPDGKYQPLEFKSQCQTCKSGQYSSPHNRKACLACVPGKFRKQYDQVFVPSSCAQSLY